MKPFILTVLMYHYVRDPGDQAEADSGIPGLSLHDFEAQLDHLSKHYTMINWPDLQEFLQHKKPLPRASCLLTFDDGVRDHYINVFPALRARGLSGLFFYLARQPEDGLALGHKIHYLLSRLGLDTLRHEFRRRLTTEQNAQYEQAERKYSERYSGLDVFKAILQRDLSQIAEKLLSEFFGQYIGSDEETARYFYLTPAQMAEMRAGGMFFGGHSHSHPWLDYVSTDVREREIKASADGLGDLETEPWAFAYPYGGLSDDLPQYLQTNHFIAGFTTRSQLEHTDPFFIGRLDGEELTPALSNLASVMGIS